MINRKVITLLLLALAMFLIATNVQAALLFLISASLIGLVVISYAVPILVTSRLTTVRKMPAESFEGMPVVIRSEVSNRGWLPRFLLKVEDQLARGGGGTVVWLPGGASRAVTYETALPRGVYTKAGLAADSGAPFGVWHRRVSNEATAGITIYPAYEEIPTFPILEPMSSPSETVHERRSAGSGYDYLGIREYRRGDSMRAVHWRSSARRGELVVKEFEEEIATPVSIVIDLKAGTAAGRAGDDSLDAAARVAATLANYCLKAGHPLRLFAQDKEAVAKIERPGFFPTLEWLAGLKANGRLDAAALVEEAIPFIGQRSTVILIATSQKADWADISAAVQARRARLIVVLVDARSYGDKVSPTLEEISGEMAGARATLYGLMKGQDVKECLREPLNVTGR
ncbi:MAG: DUF58 domain-containing protein [Actinomycetota bacterium]